jgi:segregation and condensation protein A
MMPVPDSPKGGGEETLPLLEGFRESYRFRLDRFEGPLDLLLHLVKKNDVDIRDIQIAVITRQYLEYLALMNELNLEVAGDFLLMAATLLHMKSGILLPQDEQQEAEEEESDPRADLVRRLLEYQQYKEAGLVIGARALLGREVFVRSCADPALTALRSEEEPLEVDLFELVDAFHALLARIPAESFHDVAPGDSLSITDCMNEILLLMAGRDSLSFDELIREDLTRERIIVTFLAFLELCRLKVIRIFQNEPGGGIRCIPAVAPERANNNDGVFQEVQ